MTPRLSEFVGRQAELETIYQALTSPEQATQVFMISGMSGLGKTRLLQEISSLCQKMDNVACVSRIDCYETLAHVPFSIESHIERELGPFENFDRSFGEWYRPKLFAAETSPPAAFDAVREAFLHDYNDLAQQKRVVVRFDTVEVALRSDLWERIVELAPHLENTVLLLAGQRFGADLPEMEERYRSYNIQVHDLSLQGLDDDEVRVFFDNRAGDLPVDQAMREKIRVLTEGKPVLLNLAIEWLRRSVPIREIETLPTQAFETMSQDEIAQLRQDVERALVEGILELTNSIDLAILQMAWVHRRFDVNILSTLLGATPSECQQILARLEELPFTRILPDGVCVLHDNVRDLVVRYDWPVVDPNGTQRLVLDRTMVDYYDRLLEQQKTEVGTLRRRIAPDAVERSAEERQVFDELVTAATQRWIYEAEHLFYMLRADAERGVNYFAHTFDEITDTNRDLRGLLISEITDQDPQWREALSEDADFAIQIRLAKAAADAARTEEAYERCSALLGHEQAVGEARADLLIQLGNAAVRLGRIDEGEERFNQALQLGLSLDHALWVVRSEHALAWLHRLQGRWSEAARFYRSALEKVSQIEDEKERLKSAAWLENGLGYVEMLLGHDEAAEGHCLRALELWQRLNVPLQLGSIYSTLGEVMTAQDRYVEAMQYYNQALSIFQELRAWEWQVIVYQQMAYSAWCTRDLKVAWEQLLRSRKLAAEHGIVRELPAIFHRWGLLVLDDYRDFQEAARHFERGVEESRVHQNGQMLLENLVSLVEIAYRSHDYTTMEQRAAEMQREIEGRRLNYPLLKGRLLRILAQAAFDQSDYDTALSHYLEAIPLIALRGGYGPYKLSTEILFLGSRLEDLDPAIALSWCNAMKEAWGSLKVSQIRPEMMEFVRQHLEELSGQEKGAE